VVAAQSRLGRLLCRDCRTPRDRRFGLELLRQAARAGDIQAQLELGRHYCEAGPLEVQQGRYWLEQAAAQGSEEALRLLGGLVAPS
jgi:TPR repeat protein